MMAYGGGGRRTVVGEMPPQLVAQIADTVRRIEESDRAGREGALRQKGRRRGKGGLDPVDRGHRGERLARERRAEAEYGDAGQKPACAYRRKTEISAGIIVPDRVACECHDSQSNSTHSTHTAATRRRRDTAHGQSWPGAPAPAIGRRLI